VFAKGRILTRELDFDKCLSGWWIGDEKIYFLADFLALYIFRIEKRAKKNHEQNRKKWPIRSNRLFDFVEASRSDKVA